MRPDLPYDAQATHSLTQEQFRELAAGSGSPATLAALARAEFSHRLLLFDLLMDCLNSLAGASAPLPAAARAWDLLAAAQQEDPRAVEELVLLPETGLWLTGLLGRLRAPRGDRTPLWAEIGHLHTLASVAAARAGLTFGFPVPAHGGRIWLPTLGMARLPSARRRPTGWTTVEVRAAHGHLTLLGTHGQLTLPANPEQSAAHWIPQRRITLTAGHTRGILLDDLGPHRIAPLPDGAAHRLACSAYASWSTLLQQAYDLVSAVDPPTADAAEALLRSVQPMATHERFRIRSVSNGHGVGGLAASTSDSASLWAATLVHELQHTKLSALMHLYPLHQPRIPADGTERLYYAPWRDDPRPLGGMLQGTYAFTAVARFWQARSALAEGPDSGLARFESALWLHQLGQVITELMADPVLTALGRQALGALQEAVARSRGRLGEGPDETPDETLARRMAADHRAAWRVAHVRPPADVVTRLAAAWGAARERPPALVSGARPVVRSSRALHLDARAMLVRIGLTDPAALDKLRDGPGDTVPGVAGATRADLLWATGDPGAAARWYVQDIGSGVAVPGAWSGLGLALSDAGTAPDAVRALRTAPELVAALHRAVLRADGKPPDPVALALWLGRAPKGPAPAPL
ncbi:aKG-HExxH-type peptide beta-hydroxylase [Streptomyces sp. NPDC051561]|uniref:aKG-HExxH-type peptide beta-hydroxylase n=1 Tax=Streptomyces sp. NPDC051561 TaxID=3365658 RepID=UPI0037BDE230